MWCRYMEPVLGPCDVGLENQQWALGLLCGAEFDQVWGVDLALQGLIFGGCVRGSMYCEVGISGLSDDVPWAPQQVPIECSHIPGIAVVS